tara:strand:- start:449 stop:1186 length:738 start_codon:yes stop_codon:yes gene_type:complete
MEFLFELTKDPNTNQKISKFTFVFKNTQRILKINGDNRRSTTLRFLLERYPGYLSAHDDEFSSLYDDPNKAINEFIIDEGYAGFIDTKKIISKKNNSKIDSFKINLDKIHNHLEQGNNFKSNNRKPLKNILQEQLISKTHGLCSFTKYKTYTKKEIKSAGLNFFSKLLEREFDHRVPLFKGGSNDPSKLDNWMIISSLANREKNKVCKSCDGSSINCKTCALAFPESYDLVFPTKQNLKNLNIFR